TKQYIFKFSVANINRFIHSTKDSNEYFWNFSTKIAKYALKHIFFGVIRANKQLRASDGVRLRSKRRDAQEQ
ncbi:MAG: hypothetical protein K2N48_08340, partial [Muribaculaceae bacterium]|nr:hypothetical protein [Muribaculaceae bacterium]